MEYAAAAENGDLYLLAFYLSANWRNALRTRQVTLACMDMVAERHGGGPIGATDRARLSMWADLEVLPLGSDEAKRASRAYVARHPDSAVYVPPLGPHRVRRYAREPR